MLKNRKRLVRILLVIAILGIVGYFVWFGFLRYVPLSDSDLVTPGIEGVSQSWGAVDVNSTQIIFEVLVNNPNNFTISLTGVEYDISLNDVPMGEGTAGYNVIIDANSELAVTITTTMDNANLPQWWVSHIQNGEESELTAELDMSFAMGDKNVIVPWIYSQAFSTDIFDQTEAE